MPEMPDSPPLSPLAVLLLAAGVSSRMRGIDKLLLPVRREGSISAEPLVCATARLYLSLGLPLTIVVNDPAGPAATALRHLQAERNTMVLAVNPPAPNHDGQIDSIRAGLDAARIDGPGLIIALADQPLLTAVDIAGLIACFEAHRCRRIIVPRHAGRRGNPVILPSSLARRLREDRHIPSPRHYIDHHPEEVIWFDAPDDHFTRDIDTPEDALACGLMPPAIDTLSDRMDGNAALHRLQPPDRTTG